MRNILISVICLGVLCVLTACPPVKPASNGSIAPPSSKAATQAKPLAAHGLRISLVRSDLGLGDGSYVREVDALLTELAKNSEITYQPIGPLPAEMLIEASSNDVGLAGDGSAPGTMDIAAAVALLDAAPPSDWIVVTNTALVAPVLDRLRAGKLSTNALIVLDEEGWVEPVSAPPVPVVRARYQIKDVAFLLGVAAAESANNGQFVALANSGDPQAEEFLEAVSNGAKYQTNGAMILTATIPLDPQRGVVTPEEFINTISRIKKRVGAAFAANHFICDLGRATPTIMYAMTQAPVSGYVLGAYADYRQIRPARVVGCAVKHPAVVLRYLLEHAATPEGLRELAPQGVVELGLAEDAVGFTDFGLYCRYNPDGDDIRDAVANAEKLIRANEIDYEY